MGAEAAPVKGFCRSWSRTGGTVPDLCVIIGLPVPSGPGDKRRMPPSVFSALLAAQPTTLDRLKRIPTDVWLNLVMWILAVVVIIRLWRALKRINDYAPYIAATLTAGVLFLTMVYYRNEPAFLTPVVDKLSHFFPAKSKQEADLERMRQGRER